MTCDLQPTTGAYTPKTEAISPTLPEPTTQEETQYRSSKDDLLQQISKVDREIAKRESTISKLRKKLIELEENANKPLEAGGLKRQVEEQSQPKHQSLMQKIYADNRVSIHLIIIQIQTTVGLSYLIENVCFLTEKSGGSAPIVRSVRIEN